MPPPSQVTRAAALLLAGAVVAAVGWVCVADRRRPAEPPVPPVYGEVSPVDESFAAAAREFCAALFRASCADGAPQLDYSHEVFRPYRDLGFLRTPRQRAGLPGTMLDAYDFYYANVLKADFGSVYAFEVPAAGGTSKAYTDTDGGDGWLELFAADGAPLGAAYHYRRHSPDRWPLVWRPAEFVRASVFGGAARDELFGIASKAE